MKCFTFTSVLDSEVYHFLRGQHREEMDELIVTAKEQVLADLEKEAASRTTQHEDDWKMGDPLEPDWVAEPLAELLENWVADNCPMMMWSEPGEAMDVYEYLIAFSFAQVDWQCVAEAFVQKVGDDIPEPSATTAPAEGE